MINLANVSKAYEKTPVLSPLNLEFTEGTFTALLGASGCGKTTLLNILAGLTQPTSGQLTISGKVVYSHEEGIDVPPRARNVGYVFQSYALWPHMRVRDNVAYPLRVRGVAKRERRQSAEEILGRLEIGALADRYPFELSGGQQQRVAIARALIFRPQVLLLDEPLSSLDVQLRERARAWLAKVHAEFNLTTILVTHDHIEALSLSSRVILLRSGRVEQDGTPEDIYEHPRTEYVADFVGGVNAFDGTVVAGGVGGRSIVDLGGQVRLDLLCSDQAAVGDRVRVAVRPGDVKFVPVGNGHGQKFALPFQFVSAHYRGETREVIGRTPLGETRAFTANLPMEPSAVTWDADECFCWLMAPGIEDRG